MSLAALKKVLDEIDEKSHCEGSYRLTERLALALPDGDVGAIDDPKFVDWLLEHSEVAPFGHGGETKVDRTVRHAMRLRARGEIDVAGFDPRSVLDEIEAALSQRTHLDAKLVDVIVYPKDGVFVRHKDTPRTRDLVGTLVVGLPIAHEGGRFQVEDGRGLHEFDWSGEPDPKTLRWVALFSDVDHEVTPVTSGARVTLVYSLHQSDRPRSDPKAEAQHAKLRKACEQLRAETEWPIMIACARQVISDGKAAQPIEALRGTDRDVADALVAAGFKVGVRACITAAELEEEPDSGRFPPLGEYDSMARLKEPVSGEHLASLEVVTFAETADGDDEEDLSDCSLAPYILDEIDVGRWVIRENAEATMIRETLFSGTGYFGNEAYMAYLYTLAALEVAIR